MCPSTSTNLNHRTIPAKYFRIVKNLQNRIFRAIESGDTKKAKNLQKLLIKSKSNLIVSATDNSLTIDADDILKTKFWTTPKKWKPFVHDSKLIESIIEKAWSPRFKNKTHSPHYCLSRIKTFCKQTPISNVVTLNINIQNIHLYQKYILSGFSCFPYKKMLKLLLKRKFSEYKQIKTLFYGQKVNSKNILWKILEQDLHHLEQQNNGARMFFCAENIIIFGSSDVDIKLLCEKLYLFFEKIGLSAIKETGNIEDGIEFLGFTIVKNSQKTVVNISPSNYEVKSHMNKLKKLWKWGRGKELFIVIHKLNKEIKRWCDYFRYQESQEIFKKMRGYQIKKQQKWALASHPNKSKKWVFNKYFGKLSSKSRWRFGISESMYMCEHLDFNKPGL